MTFFFFGWKERRFSVINVFAEGAFIRTIEYEAFLSFFVRICREARDVMKITHLQLRGRTCII
jgi:hypothetical protein